MKAQFHTDFILYDKARRNAKDRGQPVQTAEQFYAEYMRNMSNDKETAAADYLYLKMNRPRWFIEKRIAEMLAAVPIDPDFSNIKMPYDSLTMVFERGTRLVERPLRWIRVSSLRSQLSRKIMTENLNVRFAADYQPRFFVEIDFGHRDVTFGGPNECTEDMPMMETTTSYRSIPPGEIKEKQFFDVWNAPAVDKEVHGLMIGLAEKIAASAILLWNARPEFFVKHQLPRGERNQHRGGAKCRENMQRIVFHQPKRIVEGLRPEPEPTERKMPHHYRGWVLRTLRHEKFHRNEDGTCRVILVEPCEINAPSVAK